MNFYKRKQKWKYALFLVAILISGLSIYLTRFFEDSLEKSNIELEESNIELQESNIELEESNIELEESNIELEESVNSLSQSIETLHNNHKTIEKQEKENMELLAKALKNASKLGEQVCDLSFSLEIIRKNTDIPLILVDDKPTLSKNINIPKEIEKNKKLKEDFLINELKIMREVGIDSIIIDVIPNEVGDEQILYYGNSEILKETEKMHAFTIEKQLEIKEKQLKIKEKQLKIKEKQEFSKEILNEIKEKQEFSKEILNEMKWYPVYQLTFIILFAILAYFIFNAARRSEQNQVWAGMAKETAHQIGTPLSSLMAWVELLKQNPENESMTIEMEKDLKRLETITERFSKIGSKPKLNDENITKIIENSISYMEKRFSKNIKFEKNISVITKKIKLNRVLLIWVIENICKNAADAMKGEGKITINCNENNEEIQMYISDTGAGIDKSIIKSIFMPGITSKNRGWGLGLSLSKRIVEDYHGGKIYVENSSEEDGTTFCIILPKS